MSPNNSLPTIVKLIGRENFRTWKFAGETYLEHERILDCILGKETDSHVRIFRKKNARSGMQSRRKWFSWDILKKKLLLQVQLRRMFE